MTTVVTEPGVGPLLRSWRERRGISQLDLALRADSSSRHISFIETGRSRPSEVMILRLAEQLDVPLREQNVLLVAGGYAPRFPETSLDDPSMGVLQDSIRQLLEAYEPYPAHVIDATYNVIAANRSLSALLSSCAPSLLEAPVNAMRIALHPSGLAPRIRNFAEWRGHLLTQMERQLALLRSDPLRLLYDEVAAYDPPSLTSMPDDAFTELECPLALPLRIEHDGRILSFLSTIATFNTPMDITVSELAIETFLPADPETAAYLRATSVPK